MSLQFSFVIPVYNRPEEIGELFQSLKNQNYAADFEIVLVEDGSEQTSERVVDAFRHQLNITYISKPNTGPGDSRNYGMSRASGNYFILVDSDCILPEDYLKNVRAALDKNYADCFGGPDTADPSFSDVQRAINYAMTSYLTTGGIRGNKRNADKFQPRSFNMGLSKKAFEMSGGFGNIHPGEDPDLSIRLKKLGLKTSYINEAYVYHKRRINFKAFFKQVRKFGLARPILNSWHPESAKITYWFPGVFTVALFSALLLLLVGIYWPIIIFGVFYLVLFLDAWVRTSKLSIAFLSILAIHIQFLGYGYGFFKSFILVNFSKKKPRELFPELFFEPTQQ